MKALIAEWPTLTQLTTVLQSTHRTSCQNKQQKEKLLLGMLLGGESVEACFFGNVWLSARLDERQSFCFVVTAVLWSKARSKTALFTSRKQRVRSVRVDKNDDQKPISQHQLSPSGHVCACRCACRRTCVSHEPFVMNNREFRISILETSGTTTQGTTGRQRHVLDPDNTMKHFSGSEKHAAAGLVFSRGILGTVV